MATILQVIDEGGLEQDINDILGPESFSEENWVSAKVDLLFTIRFENMAQATGPVTVEYVEKTATGLVTLASTSATLR